ncbi:MAG TPA: MerR family transcriptional regulator [Bryobacteraceae bacterium]|jgi:DNA-binding transcriptional MerR regulator
MTDGAREPDAPEIPDKLYFRIGEVSEIVAVEPYVLRYWESEFPQLSPKKSGTGHRLYRRKDVELLLRIKHLLYEKRFTIEGARQNLRDEAVTTKAPEEASAQRSLFPADPLPEIRRELVEILEILK